MSQPGGYNCPSLFRETFTVVIGGYYLLQMGGMYKNLEISAQYSANPTTKFIIIRWIFRLNMDYNLSKRQHVTEVVRQTENSLVNY